ncbi:hypothetical protein HPP92_020661 [Vanilla planifolia]|uniref:Pentatricopeptide repeat-containing protein n=1 Tax=Vanilla planifolia TaxID=51239 RepID=A0A835PCQ9_VANPL|nr:hypothetical protein HPP92_027423 [Vanilla planifolia]KAG0462185.1 hypothetical protein HPP92_020661 [Vanilla planifolia]
MVVDEFVYSILINGLCANGKMDSVFELLEEMDIKGIKAGPVTYNTVVNGLCKAGKTNQADKFSRTYFADNFTYSTLLHGYMKENDSQGVVETKRRLEQAGIPLDVVTANILIKAFFLVGMVNDACSLFQGMSEKGLAANSITYLTMVDGYWKHGMIDKALEFFEDYKKTPFVNAACHCRVIVGLCKEGKIEMATKLFLELSEKHLISSTTAYTTLMKFLFQNFNGEGVLRFITQIEHSDPERLSYVWNDALAFLCWRACFPAALETYILMRMKGLMVWSNSYYVLLKGLMKTRNGLIIKLLIGDYIKACGLFDPRLVNIICLHLCKKNVEDAVRFLSGMSRRSISLGALMVVVNTLKEKDRVQDALKFLFEAEENGLATDVFVYSIVVDGLCKEGFLEKALDLCTVMRKKGIIPNISTYNSVIHGLCCQGCFVEAFRIFDSLECSGLFPTIVTYATLIGALAGEGLLQDAKELLRRMVTKGIPPNTHIYNCLLNGYCRFGLLEEGLNLFRDMEMNSLLPDCFTISSLLGGYCIKGDMQGAFNFYNKYKNKGHSPDFLGYVNFIKELITKGRMEEARDIIRDMLCSGEAVDLINRAGQGLNFDPLATFLELACKDGRLEEVINILEDVRCKFFSSLCSKSNNSMKGVVKQRVVGSFIKDNEGKDCAIGSNNLKRSEAHTSISSCIGNNISTGEKENWKSKCTDTVMNKFILSQKLLRGDFETYYSIIASFCSKGELQKANGIVKAMSLNSGTAH